jgi:O-6-methylguanine DNA methyltransferase
VKLSHIRVAERGFVLHAWASGEGLCATALGEPPAIGVDAGGHPVAGVEIGAEDDVLRELAAALVAYIRGEVLRWDGPLDLRGVSEFQRDVLRAVRAIPHGGVRRYRDVAAEIGRPHSGRAVGDALGRNPLPIVVPCHRVVASRGLGGYAAGPAMKERLLRLESGQVSLEWPEGGAL